MKALFLTAMMVALLADSSLRAEDWKTTDGKVYQDVKVVRADDESVTIMHHDGGGRISLAKLPPDLQKRFDYDPAKAKVAGAQRTKSDQENRHRLQVEMDQAARQKAIASSETTPPTETNTSTSNEPASVGTSAPPKSLLNPDPSDPNHHSIDETSKAAQSMRRDLSDPSYHTTAHMVYVIRQQGLGPDTSDPNHHTMGEIH